MNAIILAGGKGSRLAPLTNDIPKPLLPVANVPMIDYVVSQLKHYGIDDITFALGYKADQIENRAKKYKDVTCHFSVEEDVLGTAGSVINAKRYLDDCFIVMSGDCLNDVNVKDLVEEHIRSKNKITMVAVKRDDVNKYGVIKVDGKNKVVSLIEKPTEDKYGHLVNAGIYVIDKDVISGRKVEQCDFSKELFPEYISKNQVGAYYHKGYWSDIGAKQDYYDANFYMQNCSFVERIKFREENGKSGSVVNGKSVRSIICDGACVENGVTVDSCIIMPDAVVTEDCYGAIVGNGYFEQIKDKKQQDFAYSTNIFAKN